jgi:hypothetical protein
MKNKNIYSASIITGCVLMLLGLLFSSCSNADANGESVWSSIFKSETNAKSVIFPPYETKINESPLIQFIVDEKDSLNVAYSQHVEKVADYTKLPYRKIELTDWNLNPTIDKSTRVLCFLETKNIKTSTIDSIFKFVAQGGTLFFAQAITDIRFAYLAGLKTTGDLDTDVTSKGIHFTTPFLPNLNGKTIKNKFTHFGLTQINFPSTANVLATAADNPKLPIVVENKVGRGKVIYFNSTIYLDKEDRGFLFSFILSGLEGIPYPIANTSTIFLDDFPSPIFKDKLEPVASELNMSTDDFETKVWWPDMRYLAHKYNISLTAIPCFDYENTTSPPFDFTQWDSRKVKYENNIEPTSNWLMKDCLKNGNELGFHGYNHVSLEEKGWDKDYISIALHAVEKKWAINDFGDLPRSYVPPSNVIDKMGVEQLRKGMPSLRFLCSLYAGENAEGGDREFDFEPYDPTLFDYPRLTSGFYMDEDKKFSQQSTYLYTGIWTHFIHPDDVYQINSLSNKSKGNFDLRNYKNLGWRTTKGKKGGIFDEFENYLKEIITLYPQIRFFNAATAVPIVYNWRATSFKHTQIENTFAVERVNKETLNSQYWFLYVSHKNVDTVDVQLKNQKAKFSKTVFQKGFLYTILTPKGKLKIELNNENKLQTTKEVIAEVQKLKKASNAFMKAFKKHADFVDNYWFDDYEIKQAEELANLKKKILADAIIEYPVWNKFASTMSWQDKSEEVWKMLQYKCEKYPSINNVMYSKELDKVIGYPNETVQEYWLKKQVKINPNNADLLNTFIQNFNTPENYSSITKAYQNLLKKDKRNSTYYNYIAFLLDSDPKLALSELRNVAPNTNLKRLAEAITWLFADNNEFQKAYDWSGLTDKIEFASKLYWLQELKDYDTLETEYLIYTSQNPNDYKIRAQMSTLYYQIDRFKDSWKLANSLPTSPEKDSLRKMLNTDVLDLDNELQIELLKKDSELFYPEIKKKILKQK